MSLNPQRALLEGAAVEMFRLVSNGATPEQWAEWLRVPLEHAADSGNFDLVERLLKAGANGSAGWRGCGSRTLVGAAAVGGNADVVSALLRAGCGPDVNVVCESSGRSAMYQCIMGGHEAAARRLIVAGADVNYQDGAGGRVPLHAAVSGGHDDLVHDLLIGGACPNARDGQRRTPLHLAAELGHENMVSSLLGTSSTDFDLLDCNGFSPLVLACGKGHLSISKALLAAGADDSTRLQNRYCGSALARAAEHGHMEVMKTLLQHGADVNALSRDDWTALHNAALANEAAAVNELLDAGADIHAVDISGQAPVHFAAEYSCSDALRVLLQRRAPTGETDEDGQTPLHLVCLQREEGAIETVDLLLRSGASEAVVDVEGNTPAQVMPSHGLSAADEQIVERIQAMLSCSPADRAWRRRGLLVLLRARAERERTARLTDNNSSSIREPVEGGRRVFDGGEGGDSGSGSGSNKLGRIDSGGGGGGVRVEGQEDAAAAEGNEVMMGQAWSSLVVEVIGLESEGVFRTVVGYL